MWGIIPAAGAGTRIQPLAFSKELLPIGSRIEETVERPRAVSEYLIERMIRGGAKKLCFVISPGKSDIISYYGGRIGRVDVAYVVQPHPAGLCDALFRAAPLVQPDEPVMIGLPDTIWYPEDGFAHLSSEHLSFLLFPVDRPQSFDAVVTDERGSVETIEVKRPNPRSHWIWGAVKMPGAVFHELHRLWGEPGRGDEYLGTLVNAFIARGGYARGYRVGESYVDVGTLNGYREASRLLNAMNPSVAAFSIESRTPWRAATRPPLAPSNQEDVSARIGESSEQNPTTGSVWSTP
ncbi:MAG TPA: nucleotidyltransferase family protein [Opitutaceae bacterium]|nr:nucleotidyltransferase family protein [Opitutaceae bacterium]